MNFRATPPLATDRTMRNLRKALSFSLLALLLAACASSAAPSPTPLPSATHTPAPSATNTPASTETPTPEPSPTLTLPPTPTNTLVPFPGFSRIFEFNKAWIADNQTHFYFLNSQVDMNLYGTIAGEYPFTCSPDPKYPNHMECLSDFTDWKKSWVEFVFYADEARTQEVDRRTFFTGLSDEPRGIPQGCEAEFRIYDGKCYVAYTCYDALGNYLYSYNNYPPNGNFEGFTGPCPGW